MCCDSVAHVRHCAGISGLLLKAVCLASGIDAPPSNGLPISRRERAAKRCQKPNDLAREAVGCMGVFGGSIVHASLYQSHQNDQALPCVSSTARWTISSVEMSGQYWVCSQASTNA